MKKLTFLYVLATQQNSSDISVIAAENISIVLDKLGPQRPIDASIILRARISLESRSMAGFVGPRDTLSSQKSFRFQKRLLARRANANMEISNIYWGKIWCYTSPEV